MISAFIVNYHSAHLTIRAARSIIRDYGDIEIIIVDNSCSFTERRALEELQKKLIGINVIRSAEVVANAYEKDLLPWKGKQVLEAALYAVKYSGCSITREEIEEYQKILG